MHTAGEVASIRLTADKPELRADGQDLVFVAVELIDANGNRVPEAAVSLTASVIGAATLAAFGNADIRECDPYIDATHPTWKGRALIVVRSTQKGGAVKLSVKGDGLPAARLDLRSIASR